MTKLVGIGGRLAAGKDAVADHLGEKHGWVKLGMSDPLLEVAVTLDPFIPYREYEDTKYGRPLEEPKNIRLSKLVDRLGYVEAKENREVRRFLQVLGTDVGRNMIDKDIWVRKAEDSILAQMAKGKNVVITGVRFENELKMVDWNEGLLVWVDRPGQSLTAATGHASEQLTSDGFDITLVNDGTLKDLYKKVDEQIA